MTHTASHPKATSRTLIFLASLASIYVLATTLAKTSFTSTSPKIFAFAVTIDLTVTSAALFYCLLVKEGIWPKTLLIPLMGAGLLYARWLFPSTLRLAAHLLVGLELFVLAFVIVRFRRISKDYADSRAQHKSVHESIQYAMLEATEQPTLSRFVAFEASLLYFSVAGWFQKITYDQKTRFSYHRKEQWPAILGIFLFIILVESVGLHLIVQRWSPIAAWLLTGLSIYSIFWMLGDYQAMRLTPIILDDTTLHISTGLRLQVSVPLHAIDRIESKSRHDELTQQPHYANATPIGAPDFILVLRHPIKGRGLFGKTLELTHIGLGVEHERFHDLLNQKLSSTQEDHSNA